MFVVIVSFLIGIAFCNFIIENHSDVQDYYYRINLINADLTECDGSIIGVYIYVNSEWIVNDQTETTDGNPYGWNYNGVKFGDLLPISIRMKHQLKQSLNGESLPL